jgi:hypothetical protein
MGFGHQQGGPDEHQRYADFDHLVSRNDGTPLASQA